MSHPSTGALTPAPSVSRIDRGFVALALAAGLGLRLFHTLVFHRAIDADEAVTGLMGKHILTGREFPVFFYGQHYLGAFEAYVVAAAYALLGTSSLALRAVPTALSSALIGAVYAFCRRAFDRKTAYLSAALTAVPSAFFFLFLQRARGGFSAYLLLAFLTATVGYHLLRRTAPARWHAAAFGLLCGFLFLIYQAVIVHMAVIGGLLLLLRTRPSGRSLCLWGLGFAVGCLPLLLYNIRHPLATFIDTGVKYLGVSGALYREHGLLGSAFRSALNRMGDLGRGAVNLLFVLGGRNPHGAHWLSVTIGAGGVAAAILSFYRKRARIGQIVGRRLSSTDIDGEDIVLLLLLLTFISGFTRPRYLLLCYPLSAILAARLLLTRYTGWLPFAVVGSVMAYNGCETIGAFRASPREPYRPLIECLTEQRLSFGYTGYNTAYPVTFLSDENIVLSPKAGPIVTDRYPPYTRRVEAADRICYIFPAGSPSDGLFQERLTALRAGAHRASAGPWRIYSNLSPATIDAIPLPIVRQGGAATQKAPQAERGLR